MDKRKFQTKTLIAEYQYLTNLEDFKFSEWAYRLKDGSIIIEYDGACNSLYGLKLSFDKSIGRKGIYSIAEDRYNMWKSICVKRSNSFFVDWEKQLEEQYIADHENVLKCVGENELPY
jgi:hypothetical protein